MEEFGRLYRRPDLGGLIIRTLWRRERDSNPRYPFRHNGFQDRRYQPLTHPSAGVGLSSIVRLKEHFPVRFAGNEDGAPVVDAQEGLRPASDRGLIWPRTGRESTKLIEITTHKTQRC